MRVRADLLLVVNQQKGQWKVKNAALRALWAETRRLAGQFERVTWEHVLRQRNRRADALANQAMDAQGAVEFGRGPAANLTRAGGPFATPIWRI